MADFALLDSLSPIFAVLDRLLAGLSLAPVWRIAVFALLASAASMLLYKRVSNQAALKDLKHEIKQVQAALMRTDRQTDKLGPLLRKNLRLTGRQLWLSFWPALLAAIPILFLLAFCSNQFGVDALSPGDRVFVAPGELQLSPADFRWQGVNAQWDARKQAWTFFHPKEEQTATLLVGNQTQLTWPLPVPAQIVHKKYWWNSLIANPAGYLPDAAVVESFVLNTPSQVIIDWGPGWMRGWLFAFTLFLLVFSVAIKIIWKIH